MIGDHKFHAACYSKICHGILRQRHSVFSRMWISSLSSSMSTLCRLPSHESLGTLLVYLLVILWGNHSVCGLSQAVLSIYCRSACMHLSHKGTLLYFNLAASCDLNGYFLSREGGGDKFMAQVFTTGCIHITLADNRQHPWTTSVILNTNYLASSFTDSGPGV